MKKVLISSVMLLTMLLAPVAASAETYDPLADFTGWNWNKTTQQWYYYNKGSKVTNGVVQYGKKVYYFDQNGNLLNGSYTFNGTKITFSGGLAV